MDTLFDLSEFQDFDGVGTRRKDPAISVQVRGSISLNAAAFDEMGRPELVKLMYNPKRGQIGFRTVPKGTPGAARTRPNGNGMGALIAAKSFFDAYRVDYTESRSVEVLALEKGLAVIQLPDGSGDRGD